MRLHGFVAVTLTALLVAAPVAGATTTATEDNTVTVHDVTIERLQVDNQTVTNVTVDRMTVQMLESPNRSISGGTYTDVTIEELSIENITAGALPTSTTTPAAQPADQPADDNATAGDQPTPDNATAGDGAEMPAAEEGETTGGQRTDGDLRIRQLSVETLQADALQVRTADEEQDQAGGNATTSGNDTPETNASTPDDTDTAPTEQEPTTGDGTDTDDTAVLARATVSTMTVGEVVLTAPDTTGAGEPGQEGSPATPGNDSNATATGGAQAQTPSDAQVLNASEATAERLTAQFAPGFSPVLVTGIDAPPSAVVGDNLTVEVEATNTGQNRSVAFVSYRIDERTPLRQLTVFSGGETETVAFNVSALDVNPGQYRQTAGTATNTIASDLEVAAESSEATPTEEETPTDGATPDGGGEGTPTENGTATDAETPTATPAAG